MGVDRKFDVSVCSWSYRHILLLGMRECSQIKFGAFVILFFAAKTLRFLSKSSDTGTHPGTRPQITYPTWVHKYPYSPRPIKDNILHSSHQADLARAANSLRIRESISK